MGLFCILKVKACNFSLDALKVISFPFKNIIDLLFLAVLQTWALDTGFPLVVASVGEVRGLLIMVASLVADHGLQGMWASVAARGLSICGSQALEHKLSSCGSQA